MRCLSFLAALAFLAAVFSPAASALQCGLVRFSNNSKVDLTLFTGATPAGGIVLHQGPPYEGDYTWQISPCTKVCDGKGYLSQQTPVATPKDLCHTVLDMTSAPAPDERTSKFIVAQYYGTDPDNGYTWKTSVHMLCRYGTDFSVNTGYTVEVQDTTLHAVFTAWSKSFCAEETSTTTTNITTKITDVTSTTTVHPATTAVPTTTDMASTTDVASTTAAPSATILITLKEASYGSTEAARTSLIDKLAGFLNIPASALTVEVDPSDSMKLIVTITGTSNASAAELATKAEDLSAADLASLGASSISGTTPMPAKEPSKGTPGWAIGVAVGGAIVLIIIGIVIYKKRKDGDASGHDAELRTDAGGGVNHGYGAAGDHSV